MLRSSHVTLDTPINEVMKNWLTKEQAINSFFSNTSNHCFIYLRFPYWQYGFDLKRSTTCWLSQPIFCGLEWSALSSAGA